MYNVYVVGLGDDNFKWVCHTHVCSKCCQKELQILKSLICFVQLGLELWTGVEGSMEGEHRLLKSLQHVGNEK
jgi:hypothetical protein